MHELADGGRESPAGISISPYKCLATLNSWIRVHRAWDPPWAVMVQIPNENVERSRWLQAKSYSWIQNSSELFPRAPVLVDEWLRRLRPFCYDYRIAISYSSITSFFCYTFEPHSFMWSIVRAKLICHVCMIFYSIPDRFKVPVYRR